MPLSVAPTSLIRSDIASLAIAARSPDSTVLNGSPLGEFGLCFHNRWHAIEDIDQLGIHRLFDPQRAVLIEGRDAFGRGHEGWLARSVVSVTKSRIACLAGRSFHDGRISPAPSAMRVPRRLANAARPAIAVRRVTMGIDDPPARGGRRHPSPSSPHSQRIGNNAPGAIAARRGQGARGQRPSGWRRHGVHTPFCVPSNLKSRDSPLGWRERLSAAAWGPDR